VAYKVTAGEVNWNEGSSVARRIATANLSTGEFSHPNAFKEGITPEGQLLAVLIDPNLQDGFMRAFFLGHYSIEFRRTDAPDLRTYYVVSWDYFAKKRKEVDGYRAKEYQEYLAAMRGSPAEKGKAPPQSKAQTDTVPPQQHQSAVSGLCLWLMVGGKFALASKEELRQ
jgi:hypothetical protein